MTTQEILRSARTACPALRCASQEQKDAALLAMADSLWAERDRILAANAQDLEAARGHISDVMLDRLALTEDRIAGMAEGGRWRSCRTRWDGSCGQWSGPTAW